MSIVKKAYNSESFTLLRNPLGISSGMCFSKLPNRNISAISIRLSIYYRSKAKIGDFLTAKRMLIVKNMYFKQDLTYFLLRKTFYDVLTILWILKRFYTSVLFFCLLRCGHIMEVHISDLHVSERSLKIEIIHRSIASKVKVIETFCICGMFLWLLV